MTPAAPDGDNGLAVRRGAGGGAAVVHASRSRTLTSRGPASRPRRRPRAPATGAAAIDPGQRGSLELPGDARMTGRRACDSSRSWTSAAMTRDGARRGARRGWQDVARRASAFIGGAAVDDVRGASSRATAATTQAVGVANGTDALHLTLRALGIGAGDEVVVPANTFVATAEAVVLAGARPRFVDVDPDTLLLTPEHASRRRARRAPGRSSWSTSTGRCPTWTPLVEVRRAPRLCARRGRGPGARRHVAGPAGRLLRRRRVLQLLPGQEPRRLRRRRARSSPPTRPGRRGCGRLRDHGRAAGAHHEHERARHQQPAGRAPGRWCSTRSSPRLDGWNAERRATRGRRTGARSTRSGAPVVARAAGQPRASTTSRWSGSRDRDRVRERAGGARHRDRHPLPDALPPAWRRTAAAPTGPLPVAEAAARRGAVPAAATRTWRRRTSGGPRRSTRSTEVAGRGGRSHDDGRRRRAAVAEPSTDGVAARLPAGDAAGRRDPRARATAPRLRSGTVLYDGTQRSATRFETGHHVVVREDCEIGDDVSVWSEHGRRLRLPDRGRRQDPHQLLRRAVHRDRGRRLPRARGDDRQRPLPGAGGRRRVDVRPAHRRRRAARGQRDGAALRPDR